MLCHEIFKTSDRPLFDPVEGSGDVRPESHAVVKPILIFGQRSQLFAPPMARKRIHDSCAPATPAR